MENGTMIDEEMYDPEQSIPVNQVSYRKPLAFGFVSFVCVSAALLALHTTKEQSASTAEVFSKGKSAERPLFKDSDVAFTLSAWNPTYGEPTKILEYLPWDTLIEPYQDQYLSVSSLTVDGVDVTSQINSDYTVEYTINGVDYSGSPATVNVETTGVIDATVTISYQGTVISESTTPVAVKYIRRELRTLTADDQAKWVSTMKLLYTTDLEEGQALYGKDFYNAEWFSYQHLNGAGRNDCDHWHDGAAIATTHLGFTLVAERALQAIDPSISMPYWEYASVSLRKRLMCVFL
jgi:hypothetical protein